MTTLLHLGSCIVALEHIVMAEFTPACDGSAMYIDEDGETANAPQHARLDLTLSSLHLATDELGYEEVNAVAGSASDVLKLWDASAELAWNYLTHKSVRVLHFLTEQHPQRAE